MTEEKYVIAIGRQIGSGGARLGKALADYLGFRYLDNEILTAAAQELNVDQSDLGAIEERAFSIWQTLVNSGNFDARFMLADYYLPTARTLFETQSQIIREVASEHSCVVVGRCGTHIFKNHPRAIRLFLYGDPELRVPKVARRFNLPMDQAKKELVKIDKERDRYYNIYTSKKRTDVTEYDLTIDTGILGPDKTLRLALNYICLRFPELARRG